MISAGAYSKKYQAVEREKMREIKDKERKTYKERATYLSIQTSQRQKAMEEKKRAMIEAEEERRRKALEERRRLQREATNRFRSTIGRIKSSKNSTIGRAKSKNTRCSHTAFQPEIEVDPINTDQQSISVNTNQQLTTGEEVEILEASSLHKKAHSLENVYIQSAPPESTESIPGISPHTFSADPVVRGKSASDSNLNLVKESRNISKPVERNSNCEGSIEECDTMVLQSANKGLVATPPLKAGMSPDSPDTYSSPTFSDSLNSSITEPLTSNRMLYTHSTVISNAFEAVASTSEQGNYQAERHQDLQPVESSDTSTADSLEEKSFSTGTKSFDLRSRFQMPQNDKIVGILKKSCRSQSVPSTYYAKSKFVSHDAGNGSGTAEQTSRGNSSRLQKRVRFSDQVESKSSSNSVITNITDSVQIELWKRVFPREFSPESVRNSAFTPKMKCSLSSKTQSSQGVPKTTKRPLNGSISVHVPATAIEEYVSPTATLHSSTITESAHHTMEVKDLTDTDSDETELSTTRSLEKTPTDAEINIMWDQIRHCLEDSRKMPVPPKVYNFKPPAESGKTSSYRTINPSADPFPVNSRLLSSGTAGHSSNAHKTNMSYTARKQLVYRQPNHTGLIRHTERTADITATTRQDTRFKYRRSLSGLQPSKKPSDTSNSSMTALSLEEQRLMQSIERINQRLKSHFLSADTPSELRREDKFSPVPPSTPPKKQSQTLLHARTRILSEPSKLSRVVGTGTVQSANHSALPFHKS